MRAVKRPLFLSAVAHLSAGGFATETTSLLARMSVQPSSGRATAINALIAGLKTDGIWSKLSGFFDLAAETEQQALLDWTRTANGTNSGCTFTANSGFNPGSGPTNYVDLGFGPGVRGDTLNNIAAGVWTNVQGTAFPAAATIQFSTTGASRNDIAAADGAVAQGFRANDGVSGNLGNGTGSRVGHRAYSRTGATARKGYINGANTASDAQASSATGTGNFSVFRANTGYNTRGDSVCFVWIASALTDTEVMNLHNRLVTYKAAAGIV